MTLDVFYFNSSDIMSFALQVSACFWPLLINKYFLKTEGPYREINGKLVGFEYIHGSAVICIFTKCARQLNSYHYFTFLTNVCNSHQTRMLWLDLGMSPDKMEDSSTLSKVCSIFADNSIIMYDYMREKTLIKAQIVPVVLLEKYSSNHKTNQPTKN